MKKHYFMFLLLTLFSVMGFSQTTLKIEAESYNLNSGAKAENNAALSGGKNVGYIKNNTWISFIGHVFSQYDSSFNIAAAGAIGGTIELRLDSSTGTLIGTVAVSGSTGFSDYKTFSTAITPTTGTHDLYLVFKHPTNTGYLFNIDYLEKVTTIPGAVTYTLTTNISPSSSGTITSNPAGTTFIQGTEVTLTANKNFGYKFTRWVDGNGAVVSTANPLTITISSNTTLVAEYEAVSTYNLNVNVQGAFGLGEYSISPAGKDGGFSIYEKGTNVTITAVENDIIKFNNWSDGSTALSKSVTINDNVSITATYDNATFIAGWTFKNDQYANPRVAELYSKVENKPQLFAYNVTDNVFAPNIRLQNRGGKNGFCVWNTDRGPLFYFMSTLSTVGYKNITISSGLIGYYYGCDEWTFQYSLDGVNFQNISSLATINTNSITSIGGILPAEAEGKEKVYIRWFPNVNGPKHGSATDVTATVLSNVMIKADEIAVSDTTAPMFLSSLPAIASTTAGASGNIILNYDEKVQLGTGQATLNAKNLNPEFVNKTVKFSYFGLEYNTQYTFSLPAGFITDLSGNKAAAVSLSFKTMEKPVAVKRTFDLIVDANATTEQVASGKYVKTIAEAFNKAPSNSSARFLVLITNGTYNLGGDGTNPQGILLQLPSGKNNVSLIAQSKDKVILQGNPGQGIKNPVLSIEANDLYMENVTIEHKDGVVNSGQKPALNPAGDRNVYNGVRLRSKQDTQVTGGNRSFYYKSTIEGDVDFICGGGIHWFEECKLVSVASGYIVAPNHIATDKYGYIFNNNTITAASSYYLGRPWQNAPRAVYLNTTMVTEPNTQGWASMGTLPALFAEYNSVNGNGVAVNTANRTNVFTVSGVAQTGNYNPMLTKELAAEYTIENVLSGTDKWNPRLVVEQVAAPSNLAVTANNTLKWDNNQYASCYVVSKDGKVVAITTDATYVDSATTAGTYEYIVQAANEYGGLSALSKINMSINGGATKSTISYINSIGSVGLTNLTPVEYTEGTTLTLPTPSMQGYTFFGWSSSATVPNSIKEIASTTKGAQTFYAFWGVGGNNQPNAVKSTISYVNSIGGVVLTNLTPVEYTEGTTLTLPTPSIQGYTFFGWSSSATVPNSIKEIPSTTKGSQAFYAFWGVAGNNQPNPVIKSKISYLNSIGGVALTNLTPVEYTEGTALTLPIPSIQGYTFFGWSTSATTPNSIKEIPSTTKGAQTFYAFWGVAGANDKGTAAFPGAEGYGKYVTGGRGGKVIYVTNLNDSGAGSLRAAISQSGPKIVVFKVSGNIKLLSELSIYDNTTIAGQTSPGGGITLQDYNVKVRGNNIILRYLRFRMGDTHDVENDALGGRFQKNIIVDHCSMSWSTDECVSFYQNENFTLQWCIISESLRNSVHAKGAHGYGGVWGGKNASFHHNLLAHHDSRNPRLGEYANDPFALTDLVDIRNNVIYNWGGNSCYGGDAMNVNLVNNYWKPGPGTSNSTKERILSTGRSLDSTSPLYGIWGKYYVDGNYVVGSARATQDNWTYGVYSQFHSSQLPVSQADKDEVKIETPHAFGEITTHSATKAYELVLDHAGANLYRDAVDLRAVNDTRSGLATIMNGGNGSTNGYIDTPSATGGWPVLPTAEAPVDTDGDGMPNAWETEKGLDPVNATDGNLKTLDGGYTNIEVYINSIVKQITDNQNGSLDVSVTPETFLEKYNAAENGTKFIMTSGTYSADAVAVKNHNYKFVAAEGAKPIFAGYFSSDKPEIATGSFSFNGVDIDLTNGNSNFIQLKNGASISGFEIKNASIKGIKQSLLMTEGASEQIISNIVLDNCIVDGTATNGSNFIQPDSRIVSTVSIKNSTIYNFEKGNNFIILQKKDAINQAINVAVENNTIYNIGSQDNNGFVFVDNRYNNASTFTFKNNIMQDARENPKAIVLFRSNNTAGVGTAVLDHNLLVGVSSKSVKGVISVSETNVLTLGSLGMTGLSYPNPAAGDFSFSKLSPLATAATGGGILGDPRWFKPNAKFSLIKYFNAIDGKEIITLSPSEYMEGVTNMLPIPKLERYTFFGWSASATLPALIKSISNTATGNKEFYAFWGDGGNNKPNVTTSTNYTISYLNLPNGVINPNQSTVVIGIAYKLLEAKCVGYRFLGWYSDTNYRNEITEFGSNQTEKRTVYGRWKKLGEFYAFPTAAKNSITLKSSVENDTVTIISVAGVAVKQIKITSYETEISISDLAAGNYFIQSSKTGLTTRFIVK
jgi:uncharacterized repeat protein (TIGR02543 family)